MTDLDDLRNHPGLGFAHTAEDCLWEDCPALHLVRPPVEDLTEEWRQVALSKWRHYRDNVWPSTNPQHDIARNMHAHGLAKIIPHLLGLPHEALQEGPDVVHEHGAHTPHAHTAAEYAKHQQPIDGEKTLAGLPKRTPASPETPTSYTPEERWERRYRMSEPELMDASSQMLDMAGEMLVDPSRVGPTRARFMMDRAQWYMLRLASKRNYQLTLPLTYSAGGQVFDTNPPSQSQHQMFSTMYPTVPATAGPVFIPAGPGTSLTDQPDHSARRPAPPQFVPREKSDVFKPLPREYCDDEAQHSAHTWPEENDKLCLGRGEGGIRLRPIRDNPQA